jgi:hypothetical protein
MCATQPEALNDPLSSSPDKLSMLGFLHILKKCNVPHPDVPMAAFDRIFVEVNWTSDPSVRIRLLCSQTTGRSRASVSLPVSNVYCLCGPMHLTHTA